MKRKKIINIIILTSSIVFLFCIYFSKTIKNMMLPSVTTVNLKSGTIGNSVETDGIVKYEDTHKIYMNDSWKITQIDVKVNQQVQKGDILGKVDNDEITLKERESTALMMKLKEELKESKEDPKVTKEKIDYIQYEINTEQIKYNEIRKGLDKDGNIISDIDGTIVSINNSQNLASGEGSLALFEVIDSEPKFVVTFNVSSKDSDKFLVGSSVNALLEVDGENKKIDAVISQKSYDSEKDMYTFLAQIENGENIKSGDKVTVNSAGEEKRYDSVIPKSCLTLENGLDYVYILSTKDDALGSGFYVQKSQVQVVASDDSNCAITSSDGAANLDGYGIILNASKPITNNCEVKLNSES